MDITSSIEKQSSKHSVHCKHRGKKQSHTRKASDYILYYQVPEERSSPIQEKLVTILYITRSQMKEAAQYMTG